MRTDTNFWLFSVPFVINPLLIIASLFLLSPCCLFAHVYHFTLITVSCSSLHCCVHHHFFPFHHFFHSSPFLSFITILFIHHRTFHSSQFFSFITIFFIHHHFFSYITHYHFLRSYHYDFTLIIISLPFPFHIHHLLLFHFVIFSLPSFHYCFFVLFTTTSHPSSFHVLTSFCINHHIVCIQILTLLDVANVSSFNNIE